MRNEETKRARTRGQVEVEVEVERGTSRNVLRPLSFVGDGPGEIPRRTSE